MISECEAPNADSLLRRLLHRWLVEYNPLYLLSAALVLLGTQLMARGLAGSGGVFGQVGVAAITELYAWVVIGGAALLTRIHLRRPGVLLVLIAVLYQFDLTLHTETMVYLGRAGAVAGFVWLVSFVGKLYAVTWAVRLRASRSAFAIPALGALGLAVLPRYCAELGPRMSTVLVASWLFALFASGLWTLRRVTSVVPLDAWGSTVLQRALKATWSLWAVLGLAHVWFWSDEYNLQLAILLPLGALLCTRWLRNENATSCVVGATLLFVAAILPSYLWLTALFAGVTLCLHAFRRPLYARDAAA